MEGAIGVGGREMRVGEEEGGGGKVVVGGSLGGFGGRSLGV
jgi:hypothetical protein